MSKLWEQKESVVSSRPMVAVPSPDGHHLAIEGGTVDGNVGMIENF